MGQHAAGQSCYVPLGQHLVKHCLMFLTGRNRTGPPCSVGHPTAHAPGGRPPARKLRYRRRQTTYDADRQWRQTTGASEQNNTGHLGGPLIIIIINNKNYIGPCEKWFSSLSIPSISGPIFSSPVKRVRTPSLAELFIREASRWSSGVIHVRRIYVVCRIKDDLRTTKTLRHQTWTRVVSGIIGNRWILTRAAVPQSRYIDVYGLLGAGHRSTQHRAVRVCVCVCVSGLVPCGKQ